MWRGPWGTLGCKHIMGKACHAWGGGLPVLGTILADRVPGNFRLKYSHFPVWLKTSSLGKTVQTFYISVPHHDTAPYLDPTGLLLSDTASGLPLLNAVSRTWEWAWPVH